MSTQDVSWYPGVIYHQYKLLIHCWANTMTKLFGFTVQES